MSRCVYLHDSGTQCVCEAADGGDFCEDHEPIDAAFERLGTHPVRRVLIRLIAFVLLLILLVPFYYSVKTLYLEHLAEDGVNG